MQYEIQIGTVLEQESISGLFKKVPKVTMIINEDQYNIIQQLANIELTPDFKRLYVINNLRFKIVPKMILPVPTEY